MPRGKLCEVLGTSPLIYKVVQGLQELRPDKRKGLLE